MSDVVDSAGSEGAEPADAARLDEELLESLGSAAAEITGFSREAINLDALRRSARELLAFWSHDELISRIEMRDARVSHALRQAVSVGETYFFRQPEHFHFIAQTLVPDWIARKVQSVRVWSAGCATGEEPFSLAAFLQSTLAQSKEIAVEVLGTDLLKRNLTVARAATYGTWSQRSTAPMLAPVVRPLEGPPGAAPLVRVIDRVKAAVRFAEHNLLQPMSEGPFDLILCRNVLVYFSPEAAKVALANLSHALAPQGTLMLGSMDLNVSLPDLFRTGLPEELIFRKSPLKNSASGAAKASSQPVLRASSSDLAPASAAKKSSEPEKGNARNPSGPMLAAYLSNGGVRRLSNAEAGELHLHALGQIERDEFDAAEQSLRTLVHGAPEYLPGLFERALLHQRRGEPAAAASLMREVYRRASTLAPDALVEGPEPLDVRFYLESAETFLRGPGGRG